MVTKLLNQGIDHKGECITAPATPYLLEISQLNWIWVGLELSSVLLSDWVNPMNRGGMDGVF